MNNTNIHSCSHCACHSPLIQFLQKPLLEFLNKPTEEICLQINTEDQVPLQNILYYCEQNQGNIIPLINGNTDTVEAIGMYNGKVIACGDKTSVEKAMYEHGNDFHQHKLSNKQTLLPGLIDPHVHIIPTALTDTWQDFSAFVEQGLNPNYNLSYFEGIIRTANTKLKDDNEWILGQGADPSLMPLKPPFGKGQKKLVTIDIKFLDNITDDLHKKINRPMFIMSASMHTAYINTAALNIIYADDPSKKGKIKEQGALQELAQMGEGIKHIPREQITKSALGLFKQIKTLFETASERGVTLMYDAGTQPITLELLKLYRCFHPHNVRVGYAELVSSVGQAKTLSKPKPITEEKLNTVFNASIKLVSDGSNQGLTGAVEPEFLVDSATPFGIFNFTNPSPMQSEVPSNAPDYYEMSDIIVKKGWPLMIHANGDCAIDLALDVFENALKGQSGLDKRHRIEHCSLLNENRMQRMSDLGISPSFLIGHVGFWGYAFSEAIFGEKAEQQLDLCQSMIDKNAIITFHSDLSVSPIGPLRLMEQAVTRIMENAPEEEKEKPVLNKRERVTREDALNAITRNAAWQCHVDDFVGDLKPGKFADYIILEDDPLTITNPEDIRDIKVVETWVGGKLRYSK